MLADAPRELPGQLLGHLPDADNPRIDALCSQAAGKSRWPTLLPTSPTLHPPGGQLLRRLAGHTDPVTHVALAADGRRAVSASFDNTLRVWNLDSGACLARFSADGPIPVCGITTGAHVIVAGDAAGRVHILRLRGVRSTHPPAR